ncbi:MAG: hypothetical protein SF182_19310 [Deltaproteobacteria bacterium]|nr:hypothetical protein [Deltaproteobacteria bacterium]
MTELSSPRRGHRRRRAILIAALLLAPLGCGTTHLVAPPGRTVRIMGEDEKASVRSQRTVWYWMWGGRQFTDNTTQSDIERYDLHEVRYYTYQTWFEMLTNPITSIVSIQRRQIVVEGNP